MLVRSIRTTLRAHLALVGAAPVLLMVGKLAAQAPFAQTPLAQPEAPAADTERATAEPQAPAATKPETAVAGTAQDQDVDEPDLVPAWEKELVRNHAADTGSVRFRPGKGLEVKTAEGRFSLVTRLRAQFRYDYDAVAEGDDSQTFQIRRARLQFVGNMWGKHNKFKVEFAVSPRDTSLQQAKYTVADMSGQSATMKTLNNVTGTSPLLDWYMTFDHLRDLNLRIGQYKIPYSRQRVISSGNLQFVDRAITNAEFTLDRDLGLDFRSKDFLGLGFLKYYAGVYIGEGRNTSNKTRGAGDLGLMYLGRLEVLPFGDFKDYSEADFARTLKPRLSIAAGYAYLQNAAGVQGIKGSAPAGKADFHNFNADVMFKYAGFALLTDFYLRNGRGESTDLHNGWGWMAQAGYMLPSTATELGARYGLTRARGRESKLKGRSELGLVVGHYFAHHPLKVQGDLFQLWNDGQKLGRGVTRLRVQLQAGF